MMATSFAGGIGFGAGTALAVSSPLRGVGLGEELMRFVCVERGGACDLLVFSVATLKNVQLAILLRVRPNVYGVSQTRSLLISGYPAVGEPPAFRASSV